MESIEVLNKRLAEDYGYFDGNLSTPNYRLSFADDQYEKRLSSTTTEGIELLSPRLDTFPKYPHVKGEWVLEKVFPYGPAQIHMFGVPYGYELVWAFHSAKGQKLPPVYWACKMVADSIEKNMREDKNIVKYEDPMTDPEKKLQIDEAEFQKVYEDLYGNEDPVADALMQQTGVALNSPNFDAVGKKETVN